MSTHPYTGLPVALATKHHKQTAIAPALARVPGLTVIVPPGLDTDQLGTFTGEIERPASAAQTAVLKARLGSDASGVPRAIASEGSFGPHPQAFMLPAGIEILAFVDEELDIELIVQRVCIETNFAHTTTDGLDEPTERFLEKARFPGHAIIIRPNQSEPALLLHKGITDTPSLQRAIHVCTRASADGLARLETDMRAHHNPTRMREIAALAETLADRLATQCPACNTPGYGTVDIERGLPCEWCETPTQNIATEIHGCQHCQHQTRHPRSDGLTTADPGQCDICNP